MAKIVKGAWMKLGAPDSEKKPRKPAVADVVYQLKIVLNGSKPPIWRRLLVGGATRLDALHVILQKTMGWWNKHSHVYQIDERYYAAPDANGLDLEDVKDESRFTLATVAPLPRTNFRYEYDLNESWVHLVTVEKIVLPKAGQILPLCTAGSGACPPEESGGLWGYYAMLDSAADPKHPDHQQMKQWLGEGFDPDAFDFDVVDQRLGTSRKD